LEGNFRLYGLSFKVLTTEEGRPVPHDVVLKLANGPAIPQLSLFVANGRAIPEAQVLRVFEDFPGVTHRLLRLRPVFISSISYATPPVGSGPIMVNVTLNYGSLLFTVREPNERGDLGPEAETEWDVASMETQACETGDLNFGQGPSLLIKENQLEIDNFSFSVSQPGTGHTGGGGGGGRPIFEDVSVTRRLSLHSPCLFGNVLNQREFNVRIERLEGVETITRTTGLLLENARVTSYSLVGDDMEHMTFSYKKITWSEEGNGEEPRETGWDLERNLSSGS
jgi:type VI secretion system secreted protein Hcp